MTYGAFSLVTGAGGDPLAVERPVASVTGGGVGFFSAANDHTANVRVEFWDGEPSEDPSGSEAVTGAVDLEAPVVVLLAIDTGFSAEIPTPFTGRAGVRVSCTGRDEAARLAFEEHELFFTDVEHWLVRIWPLE
ncbi:hypothetical protein [Saccharothrix sp. ALI-22-I]|uniref:hypothetical protein n=1 Tax=Saccharothrix sp. ALI-22-I TaxID=1933778 RepID=UPI00117A589B|nr:hypothetical protein [Saccharothrix sp. ALI-22-I]